MNPLVDKALQAHQTAQNLRQEAIQSLIAEQKTIADQLKALGYVEGQKTPAAKTPKASDPDKKCNICQQTGHDGRFHRRKNLPLGVKPEKLPAVPATPPPPVAT